MFLSWKLTFQGPFIHFIVESRRKLWRFRISELSYPFNEIIRNLVDLRHMWLNCSWLHHGLINFWTKIVPLIALTVKINYSLNCLVHKLKFLSQAKRKRHFKLQSKAHNFPSELFRKLFLIILQKFVNFVQLFSYYFYK